MTKSGFSISTHEELFHKLQAANQAFSRHYPGPSYVRQPVHTVYGGAHLFKAETCQKFGAIALASLADYAADAPAFCKALGIEQSVSMALAATVYDRVVEKLKGEPVEDFRLDFEDGYGYRSDEEEDGHAQSAALELARGLKQKTLPPFSGVRIKALTEESKHRSARTLDIFVSTLLEASEGKLPENFVVTLPKVVIPEQVTCLVGLLKLLEQKHNLAHHTLKLELMIEEAQALLNGSGQCNIPLLVEAAEGRCVAAHFGIYDYTAACDIISPHQSMDHEACDFARQMMKISLSGTGIRLSDGATNILPIGPHRAAKEAVLSPAQKAENAEVVRRAWKLSYQHIRHSLESGFYQGWDLHPAQLPVRYAASHIFFLEGLEAASERLKSFIEKAARANLVGAVFDDAASGQGLLNYFLRAINCGAIKEADITATGLTINEIQTRSFLKILEGRR
jgi:citrate lyase beta subunit